MDGRTPIIAELHLCLLLEHLVDRLDIQGTVAHLAHDTAEIAGVANPALAQGDGLCMLDPGAGGREFSSASWAIKLDGAMLRGFEVADHCLGGLALYTTGVSDLGLSRKDRSS